MKLIINEKMWEGHKKTQENRAVGFIHRHSPFKPESYPCLVVTSMYMSGASASFTHHFTYVQDAKLLLKYDK